MKFTKDHIHAKIHHYIFSVISPAFFAANQQLADQKIRETVISNLKTRGNSQRNRAVDEFEFYSNSEDLCKFLRGILIFIADIAYSEIYTAFKERVKEWEVRVAEVKQEIDKRLQEDLKMLEGEIK